MINSAGALLPDVLAEDRLLWQLWTYKGLDRDALRARLAELTEPINWDYLAGNALYGGFEQELLEALRTARDARLGAPAPDAFLQRLRRETAGGRRRVLPGSPEGRLLVLCSSSRMTPAEESEAAALAGAAIDWEAAVRAAARANLTAAVQHNLARLRLDAGVPEEAACLAARARGILARNRRVRSLLDDVVDALAREGVRPILLKETALALTHFDGGRLRMMGDLDLMVEEGALDRAAEILEARGHTSHVSIWSKDHYRSRHHHLAPLVNESLASKIEIHRTIALPGVASEWLGRRLAEGARDLDPRSRVLAPAHALFHLCADLFGGAFFGKAGQLCDARELARGGDLDWEELAALAGECGVAPYVAFSLDLLRDLDGRPPRAASAALVPEAARARLASVARPRFAAAALRRIAWRNLFGHDRAGSLLSRDAETLVARALSLPTGWPGRAAYLLRRYLFLGPARGAGDLARRARPGSGRALARLATLPLRTLRRWTASRRVP